MAAIVRAAPLSVTTRTAVTGRVDQPEDGTRRRRCRCRKTRSGLLLAGSSSWWTGPELSRVKLIERPRDRHGDLPGAGRRVSPTRKHGTRT